MFDDIHERAPDDHQRARRLAEAAYNAVAIPAAYHTLATLALANGDDAKARDFTAKAAAACRYWLHEARER